MPEKGAWTLYEYDYKTGAIKLKNRKCPRCGKIMARHNNPPRWACGGCGYMEYIREKKG
ncbi:MAG: 30S ribosomal protein S27ae [Candidatus Hecatellales archaeon]|nr:MAG: 30S ribosomal protein S27ae [Candidatus Hecatellales archaeon]